jgi:hypothetical protein
LLGVASDEEQCLVETAVLAGDVDGAFLHNAEDELIDDYLLGAMTPEERDGFSTSFLSTEERKQRLAFADEFIRFLRKHNVEEIPDRSTPPLRGSVNNVLPWKRATAFALAASILFAALTGFEFVRLRSQAQLASQAPSKSNQFQPNLSQSNSGSQNQRLAATPTSTSPQDIAPPMPVLELASSTRGVVAPLLRIPDHAQFARIVVKVPSPVAERYREVVLAGSKQIWAQEFPASALPATLQSDLVLKATLLSPGSYHLQIEKASANGPFELSVDYVFHVAKQ